MNQLDFPFRVKARHLWSDVEEQERLFNAFIDKARRGVCTTCEQESSDWQQVGKCIYAVPCGHRVGQGNAEEYKAGVLEARARPKP